MLTEPPRVLVIGHGNPGRQDDGLGPALAAALEAKSLPNVTIDSAYLLEPEAAELVSRHDVAVFVDAALSGPEPFCLEPVTPAESLTFSSHGYGASEIMALAHRLFASHARGYVLAVRGYRFDGFGEELSAAARENLARAEHYLERLIRTGDIHSLETAATPLASLSDRVSS